MISSIFLSILVVFGIGLVIFVHELGHYMAARWCGARVETFSLGFGPRLFGWKRGDTVFQVAAVPLGGFVKVAGEYFDGTSPKEPGTLSSLSVPQRFLYYSGGVIMNVIFALVVMPLVMFAGLPAIEPIIGEPSPGLPAWEAGVPAGSRVVQINDTEILDFEHLFTAVAVNGKRTARLLVIPPGESSPVEFALQPSYDKEYGIYQLGLPRGADPDRQLVIAPKSAAALAGLTSEDRLEAVEGQPSSLDVTDQLLRAMELGGPLTVRVTSEGAAERSVTVTPKTLASDSKYVGVGAPTNLVTATRSTGPAKAMIAALGLQPGDILHRVGDSRVVSRRQILDALAQYPAGANALHLLVERDEEFVVLSSPIDQTVGLPALFQDMALEMRGDTGYVVASRDGVAGGQGLLDGDRVVQVNGSMIETWDELMDEIETAVKSQFKVDLLVYREALPTIDLASGRLVADESNAVEELRFSVDAAPAKLYDYGLAISGAMTVLKAATLGEAVRTGVMATKRFLVDVYLQLQQMLFGDISTKNLGGIISISVISFDTASKGLPKLFFFLAILSINLAIINLLPIPILDGGHLMFLLIEGIKGSPVSERTFGYSQVVGLVMIMSVMVFVTYQDIVRWFVKP